MERKRIYVGAEALDLLDRAEGWRKECVRVLSRAPINHPYYRSISEIMDAIDGLAEAVTGDRARFHAKAPRTTSGNLTEPPE